jgi:spore coat polysaccharide biosynthesis protein SpsF
MTSSRLPGKILKEVNGKPLLEYQIERLRQIPSKPEIWIATTTNASDDRTCELAQRLGLQFFRGSEEDVLSRYYFCAKAAGARVIARVTADCPLIDPDVFEEVLLAYRPSDVDYVSNTIERTYPRGLDIEIFSFEALELAHQKARRPEEREHVTPYIRSNFRVKNIRHASSNFSKHRWTVDTSEDFELIQRLLGALYPKNSRFRLQDVLQVLSEHPDWSEINARVEQKRE